MISFNLSGIARSWEGSTPLRHSLNFQMLILGRTMQGWSIEPAAGYSLHKNMSKPSSPWMQSEPLNFLASVSKNNCFLTPPIVLKRLCICKYPYMTVRSQRQLDWYLSDVRNQTMCPMYKKNQRDQSLLLNNGLLAFTDGSWDPIHQFALLLTWEDHVHTEIDAQCKHVNDWKRNFLHIK